MRNPAKFPWLVQVKYMRRHCKESQIRPLNWFLRRWISLPVHHCIGKDTYNVGPSRRGSVWATYTEADGDLIIRHWYQYDSLHLNKAMLQSWYLSKLLPDQSFLGPNFTQKRVNWINGKFATKQCENFEMPKSILKSTQCV